MPTAHPHPWRGDSRFGDGPRMPMCRERRAVWRARLNLFRRAGKITPLFEDIGLAMLKRLGTDGRLDPSHETVADDVGCSARTVRRALAALTDKAVGLMFWVRRLVRHGISVEQNSNAYVLTTGNISASPPGGQIGRQTLKIEIQTVQQHATPRAVAAAHAALADRRREIEGRLLNKRGGSQAFAL